MKDLVRSFFLIFVCWGFSTYGAHVTNEFPNPLFAYRYSSAQEFYEYFCAISTEYFLRDLAPAIKSLTVTQKKELNDYYHKNFKRNQRSSSLRGSNYFNIEESKLIKSSLIFCLASSKPRYKGIRQDLDKAEELIALAAKTPRVIDPCYRALVQVATSLTATFLAYVWAPWVLEISAPWAAEIAASSAAGAAFLIFYSLWYLLADDIPWDYIDYWNSYANGFSIEDMVKIQEYLKENRAE